MPRNVILVDGNKYLWDGADYPSAAEASEQMQTYKNDGFEVRAVEEEGKTSLYTRRITKEAAVQSA